MAKKKTKKKAVRTVRGKSKPNKRGKTDKIKIMFRGVAVLRGLGKNEYQMFIVDSADQSNPIYRYLKPAEIELVNKIHNNKDYRSPMLGDCLSTAEISDGLLLGCEPVDCNGKCTPFGGGGRGGLQLFPDPNRNVSQPGPGGAMPLPYELELPPIGKSTAAGCVCVTPGGLI